MKAEVEYARLETALLTLNFHLGTDSIGDDLEGLRAALGDGSCVFAPVEDGTYVRWHVDLGDRGTAAVVQKLGADMYLVSRYCDGALVSRDVEYGHRWF